MGNFWQIGVPRQYSPEAHASGGFAVTATRSALAAVVVAWHAGDLVKLIRSVVYL